MLSLAELASPGYEKHAYCGVVSKKHAGLITRSSGCESRPRYHDSCWNCHPVLIHADQGSISMLI